MSVHAVSTLWKRKMTRFFRNKPRIISSIVQSLFFLFGLGFGMSRFNVGNVNYSSFLTPGILAMSSLFSSVFFGIQVLMDKQFGFLKEILVAPVKRVEIMAGKVLAGVSISLLQSGIIAVTALLLGFLTFPSLTSFLFTLLILFLTLIGFVSLGILIASNIDDMHAFQLIMNFIIQPIFIFSGALFPIDNLPYPINQVIAVNPFSYSVDGLRNVVLGESSHSLILNLSVISSFAFILLLLGTYSFQKMK